MNRRNRIALEKMVAEADYISMAINGIDVDTFIDDETLKRAVTMSLINIGELTNALTDDFRTTTPEINWSIIRRTRDKVAHHYIDLDPRIVWETATKSVTELKSRITKLLREE